MNISNVVKVSSLACFALVSGCASTGLFELKNIVKPDLMEKPTQVVQRIYQLDKVTGKERYHDTPEVRDDGTYIGINNEGCSYEAFGDFVSPALAWEKCGSNPKWNSGENRNMVKTGEIWPLQIGNKVSYTYTQANALGEEVGTPTITCEVIDTLNIDVPAGNYKTFQVDCNRTEKNWSRTATYYFSPELGREIKYVNVHSANGVEQDFEFIRSEAL